MIFRTHVIAPASNIFSKFAAGDAAFHMYGLHLRDFPKAVTRYIPMPLVTITNPLTYQLSRFWINQPLFYDNENRTSL
jgi:hypothetical protein